MKRSVREEKVVAAVRARRDELADLVGELVAYDTTARDAGVPARDEAALQAALARRMTALGAEVDLWEPEPTGAGGRYEPAGLDFVGRPELVARVHGSGGGRSLMLSGHIDAVDVEPRAEWLTDPFRVVEKDGLLYGRGVNDMKGGIAALAIALETLHALGVRLRGDVLLATVTDEESSGAGGRAVVGRGYSADAGLCAEPTEFEAWVACRGILKPRLTMHGRAGHSQEPQPHWREGGAVNAIQGLVPVLSEIEKLNAEWKTRPDMQHPFLAPGDIVPVLVDGGAWDVTYPHECRLTLDAHYLPVHGGSGAPIKDEIQARINAAAEAADDGWTREHPLTWEWEYDVPPAEIPGDHALVRLTLETAAELARPGKLGGLNSWHDAATFTLFGHTPTFSYGPRGMDTAHAVNECVSLDELVDHCAIVALTTLRWCGAA
jgi:acetylornithine deacetylase